MDEQLENFDGPITDAPVEGQIDDFEMGEYTESNEEAEKVLASAKEPKKEVESKKDSKQIQIEKLGEQKDSDEEKGQKPPKEDKPKDEDGDKKDGEKEQVEEKKPEQEGPKGKTFKAKVGDDRVEIPDDALIRVKVDGKFEEVSLNDLARNYNGKQSWESKRSEVDNELKTYRAEKESFSKEKEAVASHLTTVVELVDKALKGEANPFDAVNYLLDLTGKNTLDYQKAALNNLMDEVENLQSMDDVERELYWQKKEAEYLKKQLESSKGMSDTLHKSREQENQTKSLRDAHGISEEQFASAQAELTDLGVNDITPEKVVQYAKVIPYVQKGEDMVKPFLEDIGEARVDGVVQIVAESLMSGEFTEAEIIETLENTYGVGAIATKKIQDYAVKSKEKDQEKLKVGKTPAESIESFDDFDNEFFGYDI